VCAKIKKYKIVQNEYVDNIIGFLLQCVGCF